jgi:Flp pilus assembly protein TadD
MTASSSSKPAELIRRFAPPALAAVVSITAAACQTTSPTETTGSFAMASSPPGQADWRRSADGWGERYRANPSDLEAAVNYAQALRGNGQRAQAVAVLEQGLLHNPKHMGVLGAYGHALADVGNYKQALEVLNRAHAPDQPDWRILSVQGAVLDQMGRHDEAQRYYATALRIVPDEPSVLSNLGLSYALVLSGAKFALPVKMAHDDRHGKPAGAAPAGGGYAEVERGRPMGWTSFPWRGQC